MVAKTVLSPIDTILDIERDAKGPNSSGWYQTACPAHDDRNRSLSFRAVGEGENEGVVFKCFAGCERDAILAAYKLAESDMHVKRSGKGKATYNTSNLTLIDLAIDKHLHWQHLLNLGLEDVARKGVKIPYYDEEGKPYERYRYRTNIVAKLGISWNEDSKAAIIPYGLQKLQEARDEKRLILTEGESDCWTLWYHKLPALGIPGVNMEKCLQAEHIREVERIYIIQEHDKAGSEFPTKVKKQLDKLGYKGKVYAVNLYDTTGASDPNDLHKQDVKAFKASFDTCLLRAKPLHKERVKPKVSSLADLQARTLPDTKWAIPDILPEGLTLLVGKPKLGKSWLLLAMLQAIAAGGVALGNMPVEQGSVLYISLEDNEKRLQKRINTILRGSRAASDFLYTTDWTRLDEGGYEDIEQFIIDHPQIRLIGIDTWAKIKPRNKGGKQQQYDEDYEALGPLQKIAGKHGVSIILVHHFRKMAGEDLIDQISGSSAMAGAVDNFLLLDRKRGETDAHLHVFGRDIEEEQDLLLTFNQDIATWILKGNADDSTVAGTPQQQDILNVLSQQANGLPVKELAERLGKNVNTTRNLLQKLRDNNKVMLKNNLYSLVVSSSDMRSNHSKCSKDSNHSKCSKLEDIEHQEPIQEPELTMPYYEVTTAVTTPVVTSIVPVNEPIEQVHSNGNSQVTMVTTLTIDTDLLLPELVQRYPQDVREWHDAKGVKIEKVPCIRKQHTNIKYLPWFNVEGTWQYVCDQCYTGLRASKGKDCY